MYGRFQGVSLIGTDSRTAVRLIAVVCSVSTPSFQNNFFFGGRGKLMKFIAEEEIIKFDR